MARAASQAGHHKIVGNCRERWNSRSPATTIVWLRQNLSGGSINVWSWGSREPSETRHGPREPASGSGDTGGFAAEQFFSTWIFIAKIKLRLSLSDREMRARGCRLGPVRTWQKTISPFYNSLIKSPWLKTHLYVEILKHNDIELKKKTTKN